MIPLTYTIDTPRCRLRAPAAGDIPHIFDATRHAGFNDGMRWEPPVSQDELYRPLKRARKAWRAGEAFVFSIDLRESGAFLGRISIRPAHGRDHWNIGFWLHPRSQGRGYMREAAAAVVRFGFEVLRAREIEAFYATWNTPSERVLTAIGMTFREHISHGFKKRGVWVAQNRMAIDHASWKAAMG